MQLQGLFLSNPSFAIQPSKLKFLLGRHLVTNFCGLGKLFYKSKVASSKILGAMATKMVATWRVDNTSLTSASLAFYQVLHWV